MATADANVEPRLVDKVRFLRRDAWPDDAPETIETHMSWVFLTRDRAYKLKKPVVHDLLDYRSLEARRRDCEAEVELNQALAPGVYLGLERLTVDDGELAIGGAGTVVEWLVVMRRLSTRGMLHERIRTGRASVSDLDPPIDALAEFYASAPSLPSSAARYRERLAAHVVADAAELRRLGHGLDVDRIDRIGRHLRSRVDALADLASRAGRLVDGHGDLRPEHILPGPPPLIIDRLSFDTELRRVDPLFDLALLSVECERLGASSLAAYSVHAYQRRSGDVVDRVLIDLYAALRAFTRRPTAGDLPCGHCDGVRPVRPGTMVTHPCIAKHPTSAPC